MDISIVVPVFNEHDSIHTLAKEIRAVLGEPETSSWELILVDDGSTDGTFNVLSELCADSSNTIVIEFRRNFGKSAALSAGFSEARGDLVVTIDGDLQDDPAEIPNLISRMDEGFDLISGWKYPRQDPLTKILPSRLFNAVLRLTSGLKLHDFNCGLKIYRNDVAKAIRLYGELHRYTPILAQQMGYRVGEAKVSHRPRRFGPSKYGIRRFARGFFDLMTMLFLGTYTWRPLHLFGWVGLSSTVAGLTIGLYLVVLWFKDQGPIGTRPLLTLAVLLMIIGVQFFSIGLLAEMITRSQAGNQPSYSVRRRLDGNSLREPTEIPES